jgi:hypothetical protein
MYFWLPTVSNKVSETEADIDGVFFTDDIHLPTNAIFLEPNPITETAFLAYIPYFEKIWKLGLCDLHPVSVSVNPSYQLLNG